MPEPGTKQAAARDHVYKVALGLVIVWIAVATIFYHFVEDWTWVDSFYFSSVAITTVGFGDLSPTTDVSKLFTVAYIVAGISLVVVVLNERLRRHAIHSAHRHSQDQ
jgi:hypothetical protein